MNSTVLITGGAGFIGSHVADELLRAGYEVRVLDNLCPQVHPEGCRPTYLNASVDFVQGDVRDASSLSKALAGADSVIHLAASVGVGQSMYQIVQYVHNNTTGTSILMEALSRRPVRRVVVASSMSIYGEGLYQSVDGELHFAQPRKRSQLEAGQWDYLDSQGRPLLPVATPESKPAGLHSVYALSKFDQETLCHVLGQAYGIETVALRFFNVYGPRQALSNPYTGVLAIFAARLLNGGAPMVFEDGAQQRDFVSVHDVARACLHALTEPQAAGKSFNIASGEHVTVCQVAAKLAAVLGKERLEPQITRRYRVGDIRHCFADISLARQHLGYKPEITRTGFITIYCI